MGTSILFCHFKHICFLTSKKNKIKNTKDVTRTCRFKHKKRVTSMFLCHFKKKCHKRMFCDFKATKVVATKNNFATSKNRLSKNTCHFNFFCHFQHICCVTS